MSIRARLIVLALLGIAPLMFERVEALRQASVGRMERARADAVELAQRGVAAQKDLIYSARALLQVVGRVYARMPPQQGDCNQDLKALVRDIPWIRGLSIAGADGRIRCATESQTVGLNVSDRAHFRKALNSREFALSDYFVDQDRQLPTLIAAFPAVAADGTVRGVVLASIDLQWLGGLGISAAHRPGSSVLLIDGEGTVVAASANEQAFVGKRPSTSALTQNMLAHEAGTVTTHDIDGVPRIFGYARVPGTRARLAVGLDENMVQSGIDRDIGVAYLQLALIGIFVLLITWFGGEKLIVRPIRSLVRTVARFGRGDLHVRASREHWVAEFEPLAIAFDDMAQKLATREEELRIANEHLEELASLDGLTGLANRRGFDRELERAWRCAADRKEVVALMMVDIDHFKLYNDRYGHVAGDTCLRAVGETLSLVTLEEAVLVARYGGEEFVLLLPGLDLARATELAEEARKSIEDLLITNAEAPCGHVTISVGVESLAPIEGQPASDLVETADGALYAAKRRGRNTVVASTPTRLRMAS